MLDQMSFIFIINDMSEYKTLRQLQELGLINTDLKVILRLKKTEIEFASTISDNDILWIRRADQKWFKFLISAIFDIIKYKKLLSHKKIHLYVFTRYDPLIHFMLFFYNIEFLTEVYQVPFYEMPRARLTLFTKIKLFTKSLSLFLLSGRYSQISDREGLHEIYPKLDVKSKILRAYPSCDELQNFNFGNFVSMHDSYVEEKIFFTQPLYILDDVDKSEFTDENIAFIQEHSIKHVCFHPRQSEEFCELLYQSLPNVRFHKGVSALPKNKRFIPVSICSTVCFDSVLAGRDAIFVTNYFRSVKKVRSVQFLSQYLSRYYVGV